MPVRENEVRIESIEHSVDGAEFSASGVSALPSDVSDVEGASSSLPAVTVVATVEEVAPKRKGKGKGKMPIAMAAPVEPKRHKTRRRGRDGHVVEKAPINKHLFKIAKKALRQQKLAPLAHRDDFPRFDPAHASSFVHLRHHVATELAALMLENKTINKAAHDMIRFEMEEAHQALLCNAEAYKKAHFGSVVEWVLLLAQQAKLLQLGHQWEMTTSAEIEKWSTEALFTPLKIRSGLRLSPMPESMQATAATLTSLLQKAFGDAHSMSFLSPLRQSVRSADWVHPAIAAGNPPKKVIDMSVAGP